MDLTSEIITAEKKGELKGETRGKLEERRNIVTHMYREGFDVKTIAKATNLPEQDVNNILGI